MSRIIRWGIVGCGEVCEVKSGPAFYKCDGSALQAVMRRDAAKAADFASRHGAARWYDQAEALIDDPQVDAVYIATPPGSHAELALRVADAGKPCYVEKPMARSAVECEAMNQAFERRGLKLFVAYYRRAMPRFIKLRDLIGQGAVGRVTSVKYRYARKPPADHQAWRFDVGQSGGGIFLDVGSHLLDLVDFLFGPLTHVGGVASRLDRRDTKPTRRVEDVVAMTASLPGEIPFAGMWNFMSSIEEDRLEITGEQGRLSGGILGGDGLTLDRRDGSRELMPVPAPEHVQQPLIQSIVDELLGRGQSPSSGRSAQRTSMVMDRVLDAYYAGRDDAFWTRPQTWNSGR